MNIRRLTGTAHILSFATITFTIFTAVIFAATSVQAAEYRVEPLNEPAPKEEFSDEVSAMLAETGFRVIRGKNTTYCDIWLCKKWPVVADFQQTPAILYPFKPGQLIGVVRFARKGADFRNQDIPSGFYALRYAQQPVDGAHVGTSLTRDFLLLVQAEDDQSAANTEQKQLNVQSAKAAGSSHPAMFSMQRLIPSEKYPSIRHIEESDWWVVGARGMSDTDPAGELAIEFVISGQAAE